MEQTWKSVLFWDPANRFVRASWSGHRSTNLVRMKSSEGMKVACEQTTPGLFLYLGHELETKIQTRAGCPGELCTSLRRWGWQSVDGSPGRRQVPTQ